MIDKLKKLCFNAIITEKTELHKHITIEDIIISKVKNFDYGHFQLSNAYILSKKLNLEINYFFLILKKYFFEHFKYNEIIINFVNPVFINFKLDLKYLENEFLNFSFFKKKKKKK